MAIARVLIQILHTLAGLLAAAMITGAAAWAYPQGQREIWWVGYAAMVAIVLLSIPPVRRAVEERGVRDDG
ncbi:hypothetical protein [Sphingomonas japonica]|uniref:Type IV secretory pathway TrbD component n=1 Tax=Sphingomonas japonica TaxID=511662 RepID=A0ABX0U0U8_9SPHN|nr:hypothetical protein [Sphingomonas japonica]NIJ24144.1 type IV secretory pathway TrbD component [Sphingomonas japonica]